MRRYVLPRDDAPRPPLRLVEPPTTTGCRIKIGPHRFTLVFAAEGFDADKPRNAIDFKADDGRGWFRFTPLDR